MQAADCTRPARAAAYGAGRKRRGGSTLPATAGHRDRGRVTSGVPYADPTCKPRPTRIDSDRLGSTRTDSKTLRASSRCSTRCSCAAVQDRTSATGSLRAEGWGKGGVGDQSHSLRGAAPHKRCEIVRHRVPGATCVMNSFSSSVSFITHEIVRHRVPGATARDAWHMPGELHEYGVELLADHVLLIQLEKLPCARAVKTAHPAPSSQTDHKRGTGRRMRERRYRGFEQTASTRTASHALA